MVSLGGSPGGDSLGGFPVGDPLGGISWGDFGSKMMNFAKIMIFKIEDYQIAQNFEANPMEMVPHARNAI